MFIKSKQIAKGNFFVNINLKESHPLLSNILYLYSKTFWIVGPMCLGINKNVTMIILKMGFEA